MADTVSVAIADEMGAAIWDAPLRGGHCYAYGYRGYYYHGGYYYGYVPAYYYGPAFYGWAYNPSAAPVVYSWGWGGAPWYGYYGYYLMRIPRMQPQRFG